MDYASFNAFAKQFKTFQKEYDDFIERFIYQMAMRALRKTKKLTPVDTGDLRNRWDISEIRQRGNTLEVDLINPLEYASFVEDGHWQDRRWVPGKFIDGRFVYQKYDGQKGGTGIMLKQKWVPGKYMARISIKQIEKEMPKRYELEFKKFMTKFKF